jgi:hypothetical protein
VLANGCIGGSGAKIVLLRRDFISAVTVNWSVGSNFLGKCATNNSFRNAMQSSKSNIGG